MEACRPGSSFALVLGVVVELASPATAAGGEVEDNPLSAFRVFRRCRCLVATSPTDALGTRGGRVGLQAPLAAAAVAEDTKGD